MALATWLAFAAASAVLVLIPGPTVVLVVSYAVAQGRRIAVATVAGVALGDFLAMTLSLAGLGAVMAASAGLFTLLKWLGAAYLVFLGIRLWRADLKVDLTETAPALPSRGVFLHAFAVTALNPKSIAFFVAFVPQFVDHGAPILPQLVLMEATFVALGALNAVGYALAADRLRSRVRRRGALRFLNRAGASCLVALGAATAVAARS
jgi:threonine/homoserine/homoserine lactone efflux protein